MKVLHLTGNPDAPFLRKLIEALENRDVNCDIAVVPGESNSRTALQYLLFFLKVHKQKLQGYDIIHSHFGFTAPMAISQVGIPTVISLWGSDLFGSKGKVISLISSLGDEVIVTSEAMRKEYGRDCHVVPHGVDTELFRPMNTQNARSELNWDQSSKHVLFPYSRDREVKRYGLAKQVVERAAETSSFQIKLNSVSGEHYDRIPLYMNAADVLLITSAWEGGPYTVKEAMACNLPIVSTDVGDVREMLSGVEPSSVRDDDELVDGLLKVLQRETRSNGREQALEISMAATGERISQIYRDLLD
jgi:glycosyltransferase involved in cell wall biosynthesis